MAEHPHLVTIRKYLDGCSTANAELVKSTVTPDFIHYFLTIPPIRGATEFADAVVAYPKEYQAHWTVDHAIVEGNEAVIEWTQRWVPPGRSQVELLRGTEWYLFKEGRIAEVRAYFVGHETQGEPGRHELYDFPYAERGYSLLSKS